VNSNNIIFYVCKYEVYINEGKTVTRLDNNNNITELNTINFLIKGQMSFVAFKKLTRVIYNDRLCNIYQCVMFHSIVCITIQI